MKAKPHIRTILRLAVVLAVALQVTSCATNPDKPRRDEPSPFASQWRPIHRFGH